MADPVDPSAGLPKDAPADLRAFLGCTGASVTIRDGKLSWLSAATLAPEALQDMAKGVAPTVTIEPGSGPNATISVSVGGIPLLSIPVAITNGQIAIDASGLPEAAGAQLSQQIDNLNAWFKAHGKGLGAPVFGKGQVTLKKVDLPTQPGTTPPANPPAQTPAPASANPSPAAPKMLRIAVLAGPRQDRPPTPPSSPTPTLPMLKPPPKSGPPVTPAPPAAPPAGQPAPPAKGVSIETPAGLTATAPPSFYDAVAQGLVSVDNVDVRLTLPPSLTFQISAPDSIEINIGPGQTFLVESDRDANDPGPEAEGLPLAVVQAGPGVPLSTSVGLVVVRPFEVHVSVGPDAPVTVTLPGLVSGPFGRSAGPVIQIADHEPRDQVPTAATNPSLSLYDAIVQGLVKIDGINVDPSMPPSLKFELSTANPVEILIPPRQPFVLNNYRDANDPDPGSEGLLVDVSQGEPSAGLSGAIRNGLVLISPAEVHVSVNPGEPVTITLPSLVSAPLLASVTQPEPPTSSLPTGVPGVEGSLDDIVEAVDRAIGFVTAPIEPQSKPDVSLPEPIVFELEPSGGSLLVEWHLMYVVPHHIADRHDDSWKVIEGDPASQPDGPLPEPVLRDQESDDHRAWFLAGNALSNTSFPVPSEDVRDDDGRKVIDGSGVSGDVPGASSTASGDLNAGIAYAGDLDGGQGQSSRGLVDDLAEPSSWPVDEQGYQLPSSNEVPPAQDAAGLDDGATPAVNEVVTAAVDAAVAIETLPSSQPAPEPARVATTPPSRSIPVAVTFIGGALVLAAIALFLMFGGQAPTATSPVAAVGTPSPSHGGVTGPTTVPSSSQRPITSLRASAGPTTPGSAPPTTHPVTSPPPPPLVLIFQNEITFGQAAGFDPNKVCKAGGTVTFTWKIAGIAPETEVKATLTGPGVDQSTTFSASSNVPVAKSFPFPPGGGQWSDTIVSIGGKPPPSSASTASTQVQCTP